MEIVSIKEELNAMTYFFLENNKKKSIAIQQNELLCWWYQWIYTLTTFCRVCNNNDEVKYTGGSFPEYLEYILGMVWS